MASNVADVAALLGCIAGEDPKGDATALRHAVPDYSAGLRQVLASPIFLLSNFRYHPRARRVLGQFVYRLYQDLK